MRPDDPGTSPNSVIYYNSPSRIAKETFLYPTFLGHYYCDNLYCVDRHKFDSFLFIYVKNGDGYVETPQNKFHLFSGNAILVDCYQAHKYYTHTSWEILWIHFDGPTARNYYNYATRNQQVIYPTNPSELLRPLRTMLQLFADFGRKDEAVFAKYLTDLMTTFIDCSSSPEETSSQALRIEQSMKYISEHMNEELSLEHLAEQAMLSPYYYLRLFKKKTGFTPHQYLITVRLDYSCYLLRTSNLTVKEIAYRCGFNSESCFCTSFRKILGLSPKQFRSN